MTHYLRAVRPSSTDVDRVVVGTDGDNQDLSLPRPWQDSAYTGSKVAPGVIASYRLPGEGEAAILGLDTSAFRVAFVEKEFKGIVLGWDEQDYWVWPLPGAELQTYDTARPAADVYDTGSAIRVPHAYFLDAGMPEVETFSTLPFGVYAALAVPVSFSRLQVFVDGVEVDVEQQKDLLPACLYAEMENSTADAPMAEHGLVRSRVGVQLDGTPVPILVPLCQLC